MLGVRFTGAFAALIYLMRFSASNGNSDVLWSKEISDGQTCKAACEEEFNTPAVYMPDEQVDICIANTGGQGYRGGWTEASTPGICYTACYPWADCVEQSRYKCLCQSDNIGWFFSKGQGCQTACHNHGKEAVKSGSVQNEEIERGYFVCRVSIDGVVYGGHDQYFGACHVAVRPDRENEMRTEFECLCK